MTRTNARIAVVSMPLAAILLALLGATEIPELARGRQSVDMVAAIAIGTIGFTAAVYLSLGALALIGAKTRHTRRVVRRFMPAGWRSLVAMAIGASIGIAGASTASADGTSPGWAGGSGTDAPKDVAPELDANSPSAPIAATPQGPADAPDASRSESEGKPAPHTVVRGESLWCIASGLLPHSATDAQITATWRAIYRLNRGVIGPDPGLIQPGQKLTLPKGSTP